MCSILGYVLLLNTCMLFNKLMQVCIFPGFEYLSHWQSFLLYSMCSYLAVLHSFVNRVSCITVLDLVQQSYSPSPSATVKQFTIYIAPNFCSIEFRNFCIKQAITKVLLQICGWSSVEDILTMCQLNLLRNLHNRCQFQSPHGFHIDTVCSYQGICRYQCCK